MLEKFTHIIKCNICNVQTGTLELDPKFGWDKDTVSDDALGFADTRCNPCEAAHGNFKAIVEDLTPFFKDGRKAETLVKTQRKLSRVVAEIKKDTKLKDFKGNFRTKAFQDELEKVRPKDVIKNK